MDTRNDTTGEGEQIALLETLLELETKPRRPFGLDLKEEHFNNHRA